MRTSAAHYQAARDELIPPELREITFTGIKTFISHDVTTSVVCRTASPSNQALRR
jgi:hypothetical protein